MQFTADVSPIGTQAYFTVWCTGNADSHDTEPDNTKAYTPASAPAALIDSIVKVLPLAVTVSWFALLVSDKTLYPVDDAPRTTIAHLCPDAPITKTTKCDIVVLVNVTLPPTGNCLAMILSPARLLFIH